MAREIERKFLLKTDAWRELAHSKTNFIQGYLNDIYAPGAKSSVRIRIEGEQANINIKSLEIGAGRDEFEYPIDLAEAEYMLRNLALVPLIEKCRYLVNFAGFTWEIDEFFGDNAGLIVAEVELEDEAQVVELPAWIGTEVTPDKKYYNVSLTRYPYKDWKPDEKI